MANRTLELTLISAKDLEYVNIFTKMEVYAVVSVDPRYTKRTAVDRTGGSSPAWNQTLRFPIHAGRRHVVRILLRSERALGDRDIGEVQIPLSELVDGESPQFVSYQVCKPNSSKAKGLLNISYKFGDSIAAPEVAPSAADSPPDSADSESPPDSADSPPDSADSPPECPEHQQHQQHHHQQHHHQQHQQQHHHQQHHHQQHHHMHHQHHQHMHHQHHHMHHQHHQHMHHQHMHHQHHIDTHHMHHHM